MTVIERVKECVKNLECEVDYEKFGKDLVDNEQYIELPCGWIVEVNY